MKIILRQDVENVGAIGDLVTVKSGFARNFLIPRSLAYIANAGTIKALETEKKHHSSKMDKLKARAEQIVSRLAELQLSIPMQVGAEGRLFGAVTPQMVAQELALRGFDVDKRGITFEEPIKSLGVFDVKVKLHPEVSGNVKIWVISAD